MSREATAGPRVARSAVLTGALTLAVGVLAACSGSDSLTADDFSVRTMVGSLPDPDDAAVATVVDLDALDEARGLTRPTEEGEAALAWYASGVGAVDAESTAGIWATPPEIFLQIDPSQVTPLGWATRDIASFAELAAGAPLQATLVVGTDGALPTGEATDLTDGVSTLGEGEDYSTVLEDAGPLRRLGQPLRVGARDDAQLLTTSTPAAEAFAAGDGSDGEAGTLAARGPLMEVADALDDQEVISALVTDRVVDPAASLSGLGAEPDDVASVLASLQDLLPTQRAGAVGVGWAAGTDESSGARSLVVYSYASADAAEQAVPELERVWAEGTSVVNGQPLTDLYVVESAEADESTVVLELTPVDDTAPQVLANMVRQGEVVFASR